MMGNENVMLETNIAATNFSNEESRHNRRFQKLIM